MLRFNYGLVTAKYIFNIFNMYYVDLSQHAFIIFLLFLDFLKQNYHYCHFL